MSNLPTYSPLIKHWNLNTNIVYLNHGSFGATPIKVLEAQNKIQTAMEQEAVQFFVDELPDLINTSKQALSNFVGTNTNNIVFTQNTTTGINTILNSIKANSNDDWLITNHNYGACINAMKHYANKNKCNIVTANIPYPLQNDDEILTSIEKAITPNTTIALIDYITSASAIIFPIKKIINLLKSKKIKVIVDAAHAPGMVDFSIDKLKTDFFVANCHKWICSPKGSAFMYVAPEHQQQINPLVISHYNDTNEGTESHWSNQFLFDGTHDYSAYITVKNALETMPTFYNNGWQGIKEHNHNLAYNAAIKITEALNTSLPAPKEMLGSIINIPMPSSQLPANNYMGNVALKNILFNKYKIEVPIFRFANTHWLRISAQLYNCMEQYEYLIDCLKKEIV